MENNENIQINESSDEAAVEASEAKEEVTVVEQQPAAPVYEEPVRRIYEEPVRRAYE